MFLSLEDFVVALLDIFTAQFTVGFAMTAFSDHEIPPDHCCWVLFVHQCCSVS